MKMDISSPITLRNLYWALYLALCFVSGWFASGVVDNYLSVKTSFSQSEDISVERPVIAIVLKGTDSKKVQKLKYWDDVKIRYCPSYATFYTNVKCNWLKPGYNNGISVNNKIEEVYLEVDKYLGPTIFRIIPQTKGPIIYFFDGRSRQDIKIVSSFIAGILMEYFLEGIVPLRH